MRLFGRFSTTVQLMKYRMPENPEFCFQGFPDFLAWQGLPHKFFSSVGRRESCFRKRSKNQYSINGWWSVLVSFTILARDQPSWAPIDSTKIQLRLEVIQNTQLPQLVFFFFLCQTVMRNWEFPMGDLISRRVESKKSLWLLYMRPLSQCMQMLQGLNGTCCQLLQQL